MNVTPARVEDLEELTELVATYQDLDETADTIDDERNGAFARQFLNDTEYSALLVGRTSSGELVGFVAIHCTPSLLDGARVARITDLFVHPDYRLQGFGRQLFQHAVRWAKGRKHHKVGWYVENMNMTAQYMFDSLEGVTQSGWLGYALTLNGT